MQSVNYAFTVFREQVVDIAPDDSRKGRASREYLCEQLHNLHTKAPDLPELGRGCVPFGSFSRRTKVCPLNDIDMLLLLKGRGTRARKRPNQPYTYRVTLIDEAAQLASFAGLGGRIDSNKILFKLRTALPKMPNYSKAEPHKRHNAVTLKLRSYSWVFDIVPALAVTSSAGKTSYYLIPDDKGDWIRTDPGVDQRNITRLNTAHGGMLVPTIRLLKYWNFRRHKPRLGSYYFETLVLNVFERARCIEDYPQAVEYFFRNYSTALRQPCPDPKRLGPDLDARMDRGTKRRVASAMKDAGEQAKQALIAARAGRDKDAFAYWRRVFGSEFPKYG